MTRDDDGHRDDQHEVRDGLPGNGEDPPGGPLADHGSIAIRLEA